MPWSNIGENNVVFFCFNDFASSQIELPEGAEMPTTKVSSPQLLAQPNDFLVVAKPRKLKLQD
jgi:hypothetical protein